MSYVDPMLQNGGAGRVGIANKMYQRFHDDTHFQSEVKAAKTSATPRVSGMGGGGMAARPAFLICYLCGQQFGTQSLAIHQPQCYVKKLLQWERGDAATRGARPMDPSERRQLSASPTRSASPGPSQGNGRRTDVDRFNEQQFQDFQEKALVPCENCGRTFLPDRLAVHLRSCKPGATARPIKRGETARTSASMEPPPSQSAPAQARAAKPLTEYKSFDEQPIRAAPPPPEPAKLLQTAAPAHRSPESGPRSEGGETTPDILDDTHGLLSDDEVRVDDEPVAPAPSRPKAILHKPLDLSSIQSRFKDAGGAQLERCQYCKRTFAPDRLARHEDVCIEKKKAQVQVRTTPAATPRRSVEMCRSQTGPVRGPPATSRGQAPPSAAARSVDGPVTSRQANEGDKHAAVRRSLDARPHYTGGTGAGGGGGGGSRAASPIVRPSPSPSPVLASAAPQRSISPTDLRPKFCTECGTKLYAASQKFCGECGFRVAGM